MFNTYLYFYNKYTFFYNILSLRIVRIVKSQSFHINLVSPFAQYLFVGIVQWSPVLLSFSVIVRNKSTLLFIPVPTFLPDTNNAIMFLYLYPLLDYYLIIREL